jgi:hypothetical protein
MLWRFRSQCRQAPQAPSIARGRSIINPLRSAAFAFYLPPDAAGAFFPQPGYLSSAMTNRFGVTLHPDSVRWAAAEGVSEDVIAAVLLLHDRSVDDIAPHLSATELERVITLVGRSPRLYPPGTLESLEQRRGLSASAPMPQSVPPNAAAKEEARSSARIGHRSSYLLG